ncbi:DNA polymerase lambda [Spatholobus suberectus]|nr:DNA polymerase lambda [Spatholobus suberectus]
MVLPYPSFPSFAATKSASAFANHKGFLPKFIKHLKDMNFLREDLIFSIHSEEKVGTKSLSLQIVPPMLYLELVFFQPCPNVFIPQMWKTDRYYSLQCFSGILVYDLIQDVSCIFCA